MSVADMVRNGEDLSIVEELPLAFAFLIRHDKSGFTLLVSGIGAARPFQVIGLPDFVGRHAAAALRCHLQYFLADAKRLGQLFYF